MQAKLPRAIGFNVAHARAWANGRRAGLAPHRVSSRWSDHDRPFSGSPGLVWRPAAPSDPRIYGCSSGELRPFDLSLNWKLTSRLTTYVQGRNISGVPVVWYESPPGVTEGESRTLREMQKYGANWVLGLRGQF